MQLQQLRAFVSVIDTGSFSAAARELDLSQPAVTRAIKQLERELQATLLLRTPTGARPSPYGVALAEHARRILEESRRAHEHVRQLAGDQGGSLSIAASAVPIALLVPQAIDLMHRQFPGVHVRLREAAYPIVMDLFRAAEIDFAIGPLPAHGPGDGFRAEPLFQVELVVTVSRGHPSRHARSLAELAGLDWVIAGPTAGPGAVHAEAFAGAGLPAPRCMTSCDGVDNALRVIERSRAAAFLPAPIALAAQRAGTVEIVPVREPIPRLPVNVFLPAQAILTPAGQALYSAVRGLSRGLAPR